MYKKRNTKRALMASLLSMVMCTSMLIGSTFAWFTDNASTAVNSIESGTLKIGLYTDEACTQTAEGKTLSFAKAPDAPAGEKVLFEPGATWTLPTLYLKNEGNLAAKYKVEITGINGDAELNKVIDWTIETGIAAGETEGHLAANGGKKEIKISGTMQTTAGNEYQGLTIDGIGITVLATQDTVEYDSKNNTYDANATYDEPPTEKWEDSAAGTASDIVIDETAQTVKVYTAAGLAQFEKNVNVNGKNYSGYTVTLENDIDLGGKIWTPVGQTGATQFLGVFDGKNNTISNLYIDSSANTGANYSSGLFGWIEAHGQGTTIKNLKVDGATVKGNHNVAVIAGYLIGTIENCHVEDAEIVNTHANGEACGDKAGVIAGISGDKAAKIANCSATDCTVTSGRDAGQIVGSAGEAEVTGCTATNVKVTAGGDCTGANIAEALIGRVLTRQ